MNTAGAPETGLTSRMRARASSLVTAHTCTDGQSPWDGAIRATLSIFSIFDGLIFLSMKELQV